MYLVILFFFNSLIVFSASSFAQTQTSKIPKESCPSIDIRKQNPSLAKHFSKPRDQGSLGWCYAFVAADLITAETGIPISATHVSAIYNDKLIRSLRLKLEKPNFKEFLSTYRNDTIHEGGRGILAINIALKKGGLCPENAIPYDGESWSKTNFIVNQLEEAKRLLNEKNQESKSLACLKISDLLKLNPLAKISVSELYKLVLEENINTVLKSVVDKQCSEHMVDITKIKKRKTKSIKRSRKREFNKNIQKNLRLGRPISVRYNVEHIRSSSGGVHLSMVTAMKWEDGKCQFKIRNSWGEGCSYYDPTKIESCNSKEGSYWISDEKLYEMADDISFITN